MLFRSDATLQVYLADKNYNVLDSLIATNQNPLVKGSTVDENGELKTPGTVTKNIEIESSKITKLFQSSKLIVVAQLNTSGGNGGSTDVKFKSQYKLNSSFALLASSNSQLLSDEVAIIRCHSTSFLQDFTRPNGRNFGYNDELATAC